jgi:predicted metal-dependent hydrolase
MVSKDEFKKEVWRIADEIHVKPLQIQIRQMKSKIGSCTPSKTVIFDCSVLNLPSLARREVIIHELLHLRYRNHGKIFKLLIKEYMDQGGSD